MANLLLNFDWNGSIGDMTIGELVVMLMLCLIIGTAYIVALAYPTIKNYMNMRKHYALIIRIRIWLGQKYLLNKYSGEIHLLTNSRISCMISHIARKNRKWLTASQMHRLRIRGRHDNKLVNGCRWCLGKFDTDLRPLRHE